MDAHGYVYRRNPHVPMPDEGIGSRCIPFVRIGVGSALLVLFSEAMREPVYEG